MPTVFMTGGAGFVGYHTTKEFSRLGHDVVAFDAFLNYIPPAHSRYHDYLRMRTEDLADEARIIRGDVRNPVSLIAALKEAQPEVVIHLAAIPLATASNQFSEEAIQINLNGTVALLEAVHNTPSVRRVVFVSSSFVYGNFVYAPADEAHPTDPIDVYGGTKLAGEVLTKGFCRRFGVEFVIVRLSAVYGPTDANRRVTQVFLESALAGRPLVLHDGGKSQVDFTYCTDAASGLVAAALQPRAANEVFNITRGEGRSIRELSSVLADLIPGTTTDERPADDVRPERGALNVDKARELLGYAPSYSLEDGMREYVDFVRESSLFAPRAEGAAVG